MQHAAGLLVKAKALARGTLPARTRGPPPESAAPSKTILKLTSKEHGKFVSRKFIAADSVVEGETPPLVYEAKFEKCARVKLTVNFIQEDGKPKVMQVTIEKFR